MEMYDNESFRRYKNTKYLVSNYGRIYSTKNKGRLLKPFLDGRRGYHKVKIDNITKFVHGLVAEVFLNHVPCGHKMVIDHIDENKLNNKVWNLQLITTRENKSRSIFKDSELPIGIGYDKRRSSYCTYTRVNGKRVSLGYYKDLNLAKEVMDYVSHCDLDNIPDGKEFSKFIRLMFYPLR